MSSAPGPSRFLILPPRGPLAGAAAGHGQRVAVPAFGGPGEEVLDVDGGRAGQPGAGRAPVGVQEHGAQVSYPRFTMS